MVDSSNNKTSYLVNDQLPEFVRRDHPLFVQFLESYYKFLEQDGQVDIIPDRIYFDTFQVGKIMHPAGNEFGRFVVQRTDDGAIGLTVQ